jgi:ABC-type lipoprotein export system ATPase subunit
MEQLTDEFLVVCHDLFKIYKKEDLEVVGLRGLDLEVRRGEFLAIIGSSGSGKSTLLNVLAGLDRPSAGQVRVGDYDLIDMAESDRAAYRQTNVGFLWQSTSRSLLTYLRTRANIEMPMAITGVPKKERQERAEGLLEMVGLADKTERFPYQLSAGEQQRVAICVALANSPRLLLADEPTGELDTVSAEGVFKALRAMAEAQGVTVIAVTHYPGVAQFVHRVVHIQDGRIISEMVGDPARKGSKGTQAEYIIVDEAGRLQLSRESLDRMGIGRRARVEMRNGEAVIRPVEDGV